MGLFGGHRSRQELTSSVRAVMRTVSSTVQGCVAGGDASNDIEISGDFNIDSLDQTAKATVRLDCMQSASTKVKMQTDMQQKLAAQVKQITQSLSFNPGGGSSSTQVASAVLNLSQTMANAVTQTCVANSRASNRARIRGHGTIRRIGQTATVEAITSCAEKSVFESEQFEKAVQVLSNMTTQEEKGLLEGLGLDGSTLLLIGAGVLAVMILSNTKSGTAGAGTGATGQLTSLALIGGAGLLAWELL